MAISLTFSLSNKTHGLFAPFSLNEEMLFTTAVMQGRPSPVSSPNKPVSAFDAQSQIAHHGASDRRNHKDRHKEHSSHSSQENHQALQDKAKPADPRIPSAQHQKTNGRAHQLSPEDEVPKASRALADHPLLGPSVYGTSSGEAQSLNGILKGPSGEMFDTNEDLVPETPKRGKTRVKRIRFEQPDVNGFYSDHYQARPAPHEADKL